MALKRRPERGAKKRKARWLSQNWASNEKKEGKV